MSQFPPPTDPQRHPGYPVQPEPPRHPGYPGPGQVPGQGPQGPNGPQGPQGQGPQGPQGPKKGLGTGAILAIVGGALALLLVIVLVVVFVGARVIGSAAGGGGGSSAETPVSPTESVEAFFTALADGDAEAALGLMSQQPDDATLLTDEVLAASNALAPITDVEVTAPEGQSGSADVTVSYLLGDTPVTAEYGVIDYDDDGAWELTGGLGYLSLSRFAGLGVTVNGQPVESAGEVEVFPGTYEFATTLPNFTLTGTTTVAATEPFASIDTSDIEPALSDAALAQFRSLVKAAVDGCVASTALAAGCGIDLPATLDDGTQLAEGTITRSLSADGTVTIENMVPTLSYDNPTLAQGDFIGSVSATGQCTQNGATGTCDVLFGPSLGQPSIDMAAENPTVLWD